MPGKIEDTSKDKIQPKNKVLITDEIYGDGEPFIGELHQCPKYLHDNKDIERGYRINFKTPYLATKSLFMLHNESVNVWSHFMGMIFFMYMLYYVLAYLQPPSI